MSKKIMFDLNEESEIEFKLSVQGNTNIPNVKPVFRFIISEADNENSPFSIALPAYSIADGVKIIIPLLKGVLVENKDYVGNLEIILGNRYFSPANLQIGFFSSLEIIAEAVVKNGTEDIVVKPKNQTVINEDNKILNSLNFDEKETTEPQPEPVKIKSVPQKSKTSKIYKQSLKNILKDALK
jgi:hypothetical protein